MDSNHNSSNADRVLIQSVLETLNQGETLLQEMDDAIYTCKMETAFNASMGGHYRHCLDHFRSLLEAVTFDELNYDHRERDTLIEKDRFAALNATRFLRESYEGLSGICLNRKVVVRCKTSYAASGSQISESTLGREIMYVVAHAVHHYALMGVMGGLLGLKMPPGFGVAPSTLKHQKFLAEADSQ